jgi:hypothetical protein
MRTLLLTVLLAACEAHVGTAGLVTVPKNSATTCAGFCSEMGLKLSSVVVMANNVGCVCAPTTTARSDDAGGAAVAGMATLLLEDQQRQQQMNR